MEKQDGLTVVESKPLISPEKIQDKTLDQMTLPERTALLKEAYSLIESGDITDDELEVIGRLEASVEQKVASWGLIVQKIKNASDLCLVEADYYQKKANEAKERGQRFQAKVDRMAEFIKLKMIEVNKKSITTSLLTVSLRKKPQKVEFIGEPDINDPEHRDFVRTTVSQSWDKNAIKAKLNEGQIFKTMKLSEPDFSISIKES